MSKSVRDPWYCGKSRACVALPVETKLSNVPA
jgi:hypothetical protein